MASTKYALETGTTLFIYKVLMPQACIISWFCLWVNVNNDNKHVWSSSQKSLTLHLILIAETLVPITNVLDVQHVTLQRTIHVF